MTFVTNQQTTCPRCGNACRTFFRVSTRKDGQAQRSTARYHDGQERGTACMTCIQDAVRVANSPENVARKAAARLAAKAARSAR